MRWPDLDEEGFEGAAGLVVAEEAGSLKLFLLLLHLCRRRDEVVEQHRHRDLRRGVRIHGQADRKLMDTLNRTVQMQGACNDQSWSFEQPIGHAAVQTLRQYRFRPLCGFRGPSGCLLFANTTYYPPQMVIDNND